jgi:TolB-like protein
VRSAKRVIISVIAPPRRMPDSSNHDARDTTLLSRREDASDTSGEASAALERILASRTFRAAEGQRNFLRYAVEQTLAGRSEFIKEYTIGSEVFHRGDNFDPRVDNIVRAEARKLRARLAKYYETEGENESIQFAFPKGSYVPSIVAVDRGQKAVSSPGLVVEDSASEVLADSGNDVPIVTAPLEANSASHDAPQAGSRLYRWGAVAAVAVLGAGSFLYLRYREPQVAAPSVASVAVLPFTTLGNDRKDDSFGDGLTEELIDSLARQPGVHVVARASAFQLKGKQVSAQELGKQLHVRTVLEGTVRQYGDRLRVTAELDETRTGYTLWSRSFDRELKDVLDVQREISSSIVAALGSSLTEDRGNAPSGAATTANASVNPEAYQAWLRGLYYFNKRNADSVSKAIGYFESATKIDPGYAQAWLGLARCYVLMPVFTAVMPARDAIARIRETATKALQLDSSLVDAHIELGAANSYDLNWAAAEDEFRSGLALDPGNAVGHRTYANFLARTGRLDEELVQAKAALDLDPLAPTAETAVGRAYYHLNRLDESIMHYKQAQALDPESGGASQGLAMTYLAKHMYREGVAEALRASQLMGGDAMITSDVGYAYAVSGDRKAAGAILERLLKWSGKEPLRSLPIAHVYIGLGDKDQAFYWLGKALDEDDVNIYLESDPLYAPLRGDVRFQALLKRMKLS